MKFLSDILAKAGLTVDGVVTFNNTATGQTPATGDNSTKLATTAFIKNQSYITANQTITVSGDATGSGTTSIALTLANSGVTAGTYGNASNIPTIVVDAKGRITSISTNAVSIVTTLAGLSDVTLTSPSANQVLQYNGTQWVNGAAPTTYTLPIATASTLGGIKVGSGLSIDAATGVLSAAAGSNSSSVKSTQTFIATAGQTVFTISGGYTVGLIDVFLNGVYLSPNQTTATNGTTVILGTAAAVDDVIDVIIASPIYQGSTVTTDQLPEGSTNLYFTNARVLSALSGRTLTINGTTYDLSANRSWSVGTVTSVSALTIGTSGTDITSTVANSTSTPVITLNIPDASASARGVVTTSAQTFAGAKTFSSTVAINTTSPYDTTQFSLDVNGGLLVKNIGRTAQFVLINSNPASGGNAGFVVHTVGGTSASSFADIQGYYGTSIAGSTVLRLNPQGGNVLVGSLAGSGTRIVVADATGVLSTQAAQTLNDLNGVPTSRTITINGTTFDLTANRSFTINSMVYPGAGIAVSTGSAWGTSLTDNSSNWNTAFGWGNHASAGYATTTYVNTQVANLVASAPATLDTLNELAAALGNDAAFSTTVSTALGNRLRVDINTQGLSATLQGYGRTNLGLGTAATSNTGDFVAYRTFGTAANNNTGDFAAASHTHSIANVTGLQTALDGKQASGSYAASVHSHIISDVTGLQTALDGKQASLGFTPVTNARTLTINGTSYDLSANRSWSVGTVVGNSNVLSDANGVNVTVNGGYFTGFNPTNIPSGQSSGDWGLMTFPVWTGNSGGERYVVQLAANLDQNDNIYIRKFFNFTSPYRTAWHVLLNSANISSYAITSLTDTLATVTGRGASTTSAITINRNTTGLILNRDAVTNYNGIYYSTAGSPRWFIGMRENLSSNNHIHYSEQIAVDVLTLNIANGNATIYGNLAAANFSGTHSGTSSGTNTGDQDLSGYVTLTSTQTITGQKTISREAASYGGTTQSFLITGGSGNGALTINSASAYAYMNFAQGGTTKMEMGIIGTAGARYGSLYINRNIQVGEAGASIVIYKSNGFVGINNVDPGYQLDVNGTGRYVGLLRAEASISGGSGQNTAVAIRIAGFNDYPSLELGVEDAYVGVIRTYGNDMRYYAGHWRSGVSSEDHSHAWYTSRNGSADWSTVKMRLNHNGLLGARSILATENPSIYNSNLIPYGSGIDRTSLWIHDYSSGRKHGAVISCDNNGEAHLYAVDFANTTGDSGTVGAAGGWGFNLYYDGLTNDAFNLRIGQSGTWTRALKIDFTRNVTWENLASFSVNSIISTPVSLNATTYNQPAVRVNSSGTGSAGAAFAIQQITAEGWTGVFVDFEPNTGWGLYHDNPNNYFCITAEAATGSLRSFTVPSRESGNRTAHEKIRFDQGNGSILAGGDITAFSDARSKDNIQVITNAVDKVKAIRGVTYTKIDSEGEYRNIRHAGVLAQEVLEVLPEVVHEDHNTGMYSVAYGNMAGLFIEAIKELKAENDIQKTEIEELKDLVKKLINR